MVLVLSLPTNISDRSGTFVAHNGETVVLAKPFEHNPNQEQLLRAARWTSMAKQHFRTLHTTFTCSKSRSKERGVVNANVSKFIMATIGIALFTDLFLYGLLVPVLPFLLEDRIGIPDSQIQSYTSGLLAAYAGSSVLTSPIAGVIADKISTRQAPFLLGLAVLIFATLLVFAATTVPLLIFARVLQGMSSGLVWTIGLALLIETVGPKNLGKSIGTIFSFISVRY
jgi:hypothetical protein